MSLNQDSDVHGDEQALFNIGKKRPTMLELENYVIRQKIEGAGVVVCWESLGLRLLISQNILDIIKEDCHDVESCCKKMFDRWLNDFPKAKWNDLIQAFNDIEKPVAASELKKSLIKNKKEENLSMSVEVLEPHRTSNSDIPSLDFSKEDDIYVAFRKLTWIVIDLLRPKPVRRVKMECYSYCKLFYKSEGELFLRNLKQAPTIDDLFEILNDSSFFNFLNLKMLKSLAKVFDLKDIVCLIKDFKSAFASMPFKEILLLPGIEKFVVEGGENINLVKVKAKFKDENITYGYVVEKFVFSLADQILRVHVNSILPDGFLEGSIIIKFCIPSYLKKSAIQSAFCSMQALSTLDIAFIEIDSYKIECNSKNTDESPFQVLYKSYDFLVKNLKPSVATEILSRKKLLHQIDIEIINIAPSQYAQNLIILEHLRCVDFPSLFVFCYELKKNEEQQYIGSFMLNALESAGFSVIHVFQDQQLMHYDSKDTAFAQDQFESLRHERQSLSHNSDCYRLSFMDFIDQLCETLMSNVPDATIIFMTKCSELMASVLPRIKLFPPAYLRALCQCIDVIMLLRALSPYLTWHSHSILSVLVESCNNPKASELLNSFNSKINDTQPIYNDLIPAPNYIMTPDDRSLYTILTTKVSINIMSVTLKYINEVKHTMANKFQITEHSFQLLAINEDPVTFYWMILKTIVPIICKQLHSCLQHFKEKGWIEICIYPNTVFRIDECVKVGSLAYLEKEFSEKWDDTVKLQLNRIEVLPELLVNYNQEMDVTKQIQDDEKEQNILLLNEKIAQLEKELAQSRSSAVIHHEKNLSLVKQCSDLKENLVIQYIKIQNLEYSVYYHHECANKQAFIKENKTTQTELHEEMQLSPITETYDFICNEAMDFLKAKYQQIRYLSEKDSWPPVLFKGYANLRYVYHKSEADTQKKLNASATSKMISPQVLIHEVFTPIGESLPNRILIEGNPGIGKTTLTREICYQWSKGTLLTSDKLVLLLLCRDPGVQNITSLMEFIQYFFPPTMKLNKIVEDLEATKHQITIIIDGFDELSLALQQKSFLRDLIERKILKNVKILITSRPYASTTLHQYVDKMIEIIGFDLNSRHFYMCEVLKDKPVYLKQLQRHFQMYPNIDVLCYNPLFLTIVLFMCLLESLPSTATEMFNDFVIHSINHYFKKKERKFIVCIDSFEKFPQLVKEKLTTIEKLAFTGLAEDKIMFTLADLPALCKDDPTCFGLLQLGQCYTTKGMNCPAPSFYFLHLEIQYYLAARYVASLPTEKMLSLLENSFLPQDEEFLFSNDPSAINNFRSSHVRFANMWIYCFGLTGSNTIKHFLYNYGCSSSIDSKPSLMESQCNPIVKDIFRNPVNSLFLFQCFQEAQDNENDLLLYTYFDNSIDLTGYNYKLQLYQVTSLGAFLSKSKKAWAELNLYNCGIQDHGANILHNYLAYSKITIKTINLCSNNLTAISSSYIGHLIANVKANCVLLSKNIINVDAITNAVSETSFLKELWLTETGITKDDAKSLAKLIDNGLVELYVNRNQLGDEGTDILSHAVCKSTKLKVLDISSNDITAEGTKAIALAVQNIKSLNTLWIGNNAIGHEGAKAIADAMLHSITLQELLLNGVETIDTELALLILNRAINNRSTTLLYLPSVISNEDQKKLKTILHNNNLMPPRNTAPLELKFL